MRPEHADALLDHLTDFESQGIAHAMCRSTRNGMYRELLELLGGPDPRHVVGVLHFDLFSPFKQRKDDYSIGYLLARPVVGPTNGCLQSLVAPWVIFDGPEHVLSLGPICTVLRQQCIECLSEGVSVSWPIGATTERAGLVFKALETFKAHFAFGCFVADQPALATGNSHMPHSAMMACRWGSVVGRCRGGNVCQDMADPDFDKSDLESIIGKGVNNVTIPGSNNPNPNPHRDRSAVPVHLAMPNLRPVCNLNPVPVCNP